MRAYKRELTFLSLARDKHLEPLANALNRVEVALADGAHVEVQRVKSISSLWDIPEPKGNNELSRVSVEVERIIKSALSQTNGVSNLLVDLGNEEQLKVLQEVADFLSGEAKVNKLSIDIVSETQARGARSLSIREAWIYRDFQSGIGDMMICEVSSASRRFDVLGFKEFERLLNSDDDETKRWMHRLVRVFDGLDISAADKFDARVVMLEHTLLATIDVLVALTKIDKGRKAFAVNTLREAERIKKDQSWRKVG